MRILILGGYGFLGQHIAASLCELGYKVQCTSRKTSSPLPSAPWSFVSWDGQSPSSLLPLLAEHPIIINLIGENIGLKRWTKKRKKVLLRSRLRAIKALQLALQHMHKEHIPLPKHIIQASASGYYGLWDNCHTAPICTEQSQPVPHNTPESTAPSISKQAFLPFVCQAMEKALVPIEDLGIKTCIVRFAPVLGRAWISPTKGGATEPASFDLVNCAKTPLAGLLYSMVPPFRLRLGAVIGSGHQPLSWVHIFDLSQSINHIVQKSSPGIYNICSPYPSLMRTFVEDLSHCLDIPAPWHIPAPIARLALGQMADEMLNQGQKCSPQRLLQEGFSFRFTRLQSALNDCLCQDDFDDD